MKKFVKVLDGEMSNAGGFKYKINEVNEAMNWNPKADEAKAMGGFSFSSEDKIFRWLLRGNTIYDVEIPIDAEKQKILGKTKAEDLETKARELEIEIPEGYKIQPKSTTTKTWSRENLNRYKGKAHSEIFGTQTSQKQAQGLKSNEEFEQYLSEHNNTWLKKFFNGSNRDIRRYDRYLGNNQISKPSEETPKTESEQKQSSTPKALESKPTKREQQFDKAAINRYKEHLKGSFSNKKIQEGSLKVGDSDMNVKSTTNKKNGKITYDIHFGNKHFYNLTQDKAKKRIFDLVKQNRKQVNESGKVSKKSTKEIGKILQDLKRKGWLKQGGTINSPYIDNVIEDFLKNNNI